MNRFHADSVFDFAANDAGIGVAFTQTMSLCYAGSPKAEAGFQLMMGCGGMACTVADISGKILKNLPDRNLYMGNTLRTQSTQYMGEALGRWAARVSIGLAVVAAMPEVQKGIEEWN